jgi:hypothetical protein
MAWVPRRLVIITVLLERLLESGGTIANEAFLALVKERVKPKSTKEIARKAVEEEFRARKKKRKRGGIGGSSSEESDDSDREDVPSKQELLIPAVAKKKARAEHESKYRDQAKERREGKTICMCRLSWSSIILGVSRRFSC